MSTPATTAQDRRPPLVLVVDDQEWSARAFESVLSPHGYSVIRCRSARQTLEHIQTISPDALLIKADLPDLTGPELCRTLRAHAHVGATTPIFLASTAPMRRIQRLEALGSGAWDLISLPVDSEELLLRLGVYVRSKFEADRAREESLLDVASGLYSIHGLLRRVRELSLDAYRHHSPIACVVIGPEDEWAERTTQNAESVPSVNADRLVRLMNNVGRRSDAIGRLSQTEFVVVAPRTGSEAVLKMAQRLHEAAEAFHTDEGGSKLRVRVGCYAVDDFHEAVIEPVEILVRATMALRRAQRDTTAPPICYFGQSYSAS
ncbi:MAG: response regulator [Longimicrobiales bacterium]